MIAKITRTYMRTYPDNEPVRVNILWESYLGRSGSTEGPLTDPHIKGLLERACSEGVTVEWAVW